MLNRRDKSGYSSLVLYLSGKALSLSPLSMTLAGGVFIDALYIPSFLIFFPSEMYIVGSCKSIIVYIKIEKKNYPRRNIIHMSVRLAFYLLSYSEMGAMEILYLNISQDLSKISLERQIAFTETCMYIRLFSLIFIS